ncbi:hypothetical protein CVD28_07030 [Bacillus sp. M6-12]|uniref:PRK06851 family protein n=1 Tax=Bacillus sp. M6-12 TaxID=2054166 RepID=UPI000C791C47|nr:PRK06851 family protein [Bacillus sp. M6-12]PLS18413.1 hypothetical protein CVD28_07030 [Bacillus sp. M6-12]
MSGKIKHYYAGGNTSRGFYSLYDSNLQGLEKIFILKGGPGTGKSTLMRTIGLEWRDKGFDIEFMHCSSDNHSIDGVIIPKLKIGIVDGTAPHVIEPHAPGAIEEYVNLGAAWDADQLALKKDEICQYTSKISSEFASAYSAFAAALRIHDDWEKIYIENMDFVKADQLGEKLLKELFGEIALNKKADVRHRFLGAATPQGACDFVPNLTEGLNKRYFIKGRAGTGKSTILKKVAAQAELRGFDSEIYHCGFDPHSLDMVIVRELGIAIFDSTAPHEYFPSREGDEIIDVYNAAVTPGTDEKYAEEIKNISSNYAAKMKEGTAFLAKAKALHDELEEIYKAAMDFSKVTEIRDEIKGKIEKLASVTSSL